MSTTSRPFDMPGPDQAKTVAEFLAAMRALREWASLTYRDLESLAQSAGDKLPRGTIPELMARNRLPAESIITAFVRACIGDGAEVDSWVAARRRIAKRGTPKRVLAEEVHEWLNTQTPQPAEPAAAHRPYTEGRLAEAAAGFSGDRWVGVHRRRQLGVVRRLFRKRPTHV